VSTSTAVRPADLWARRWSWLPDLVLGLIVLVAGLYEAATTDYVVSSRFDLGWVAVATGAAVGLSRRLPIVSLSLVWLTCGYEVVHSYPVLVVQVTIAVVAFGTARWGHPVTVLLSALSIPVAGALATVYADEKIFVNVVDVGQYRRLLDTVQQFGTSWQIGAAVLGMAVLGVPWLAGLTLRFSDRASVSRVSQVRAEEEAARAQRESEQAHEIARLREEQTQLAHDVHDVVGHSLAVILAQAESAQFLDEADTGALRLSMANIASSARASLQDVRQVLTATNDPAAGPGALKDLVEGVRSSGHEVRFEETGTPRPLAPELTTVAYRVVQEMLTNAIRHGSRNDPITVDLRWGEALEIRVGNVVGQAPAVSDPSGGQGVEGMRRRLTSVGGLLEVATSGGTSGGTYTATATVPVRTVYS
jgi:signal transduction histidine kinase